MSFFDEFPLWARLIISLGVLLLLTITIPIITLVTYTAQKQGSYVEIGPFKLGEREDPSVEKCEIFLRGKIRVINSLQYEVANLTKLLQSEVSVAERAIDDLKSYARPADSVSFDLSGERKREYKVDIWEELVKNSEERKRNEKDTRENLIGAVKKTISAVENLGDGCLNSPSKS